MNRRIVVTGGASGLGRAIGERYLAAGWRVLLTDVDPVALKATADELAAGAGGRLSTMTHDVRDDAAWDAVREWCEREWRGLDVLVNNAGVAAGGRMELIPMADWDWILQINLLGVIRGCRTFVPLFKQQGHGHLVNIASLAGIANLPAMASYNVSKAGVIALSQTLHVELQPYGVRTSVVCPAFVSTNLGASMRSPDPAAIKQAQRWMDASKVTAADVAEMVEKAVQDKRFLVLTHREGHVLWRLRRLSPGLVDRMMVKRWDQARRRLEKGL